MQTVALEELNLEYINLKQAQGSKDDLNPLYVSLKTQYGNIKAKVSILLPAASSQLLLYMITFSCMQYEALLKMRNQMDLDMAPLKVRTK